MGIYLSELDFDGVGVKLGRILSLIHRGGVLLLSALKLRFFVRLVVVAEVEILVVVFVVLGGVWGRRLCARGDFLFPMGVELLLTAVGATDKSASDG